jgi:phage-related protein
VREVIILDNCLKEIKKFPQDIMIDILDLTTRLQRGEVFGMPLSRPMTSISKSVFELRLRDRTGAYRVIYYTINSKRKIFLIHAFKKKSDKTQRKNINLAIKRLRSIK